jgi:hypothetical protein
LSVVVNQMLASVSTELQKARRVNWPVVMFACGCNVLSVAALHYEQYIYYVVRRPQSPIPSIAFGLTADDAISLYPVVFVLLVRKCVPVVATYALVLFLIFLGRIYLLMPSSIVGFDGPSMSLDAPFIILFFFGKLSGLGVIVVAPIILIYTFIKWVENRKGAA